MNSEYQNITIKDENGKVLYFPRDYQYIRYAPAACCQVISRIVELRNFLNKSLKDRKISDEVYRMLQPFVQPVVMEEKFLSGKLVDIDEAIKELIEKNPSKN